MTGRSAIAKLYEEGWGVPQSYDQAFYWYKLAADDGFPPAVDAVGIMYQRGWGVDPGFKPEGIWKGWGCARLFFYHHGPSNPKFCSWFLHYLAPATRTVTG